MGKLFRHRLPGRWWVEEIRRQKGVQNDRIAAQAIGKTWRAAHDFGDEIKQRRICLEKREELNACRQL